ncbi:NLRP3 protein, partial [Polyodon spathula]|nr:NLRP3 protein [Polyodon spathula]
MPRSNTFFILSGSAAVSDHCILHLSQKQPHQLPLGRLLCLLHHLAAYLQDGSIQRSRSTHPSSVKSPIPLFQGSVKSNWGSNERPFTEFSDAGYLSFSISFHVPVSGTIFLPRGGSLSHNPRLVSSEADSSTLWCYSLGGRWHSPSTNVKEVLAIADRMLEKKMIHPETYSKIRGATTRQDQMRELYTALDSGGPIVKAEFSKILQDMNLYLVQNLMIVVQMEIVELRVKYKESVRCEYKTVQEYNSLTGESVQLNERYTKLLIIQKHCKQKEREEELRSRGNSHQEVMNKRDSDMFS